jgi:glycerol-3-phosphate dehydrogenase
MRSLEASDAKPRVALTKGIHVVVPHSRLPITHTVVFEASDRRPVVAVPRGDVTYLGTTDTFHADAEYWPAIEEQEVEYLFAATARTFNTDPLSADDVVSSWTGIRPLVAQPGKSPAEISRRDEVWTGPAGVLSIAGGKLTAYRPMAERVVNMVGKALGQSTRPGDTDRRVLVGGDCDPAELAVERNEGSASWRRLVDLYGAEARDVDDDGGDVAAEVRHAVRNEGALRLEDYWVRRSVRALYDLDAGLSILEPASGEMAKLLGWTEDRRIDEVSECRARHARDNALFNET